MEIVNVNKDNFLKVLVYFNKNNIKATNSNMHIGLNGLMQGKLLNGATIVLEIDENNTYRGWDRQNFDTTKTLDANTL